MFSDKKLDQILHALGYEATASLLFLSRWIFALCSSGEYLECSYAGLMQRDATIWANRILAQTRSSSSRAI